MQEVGFICDNEQIQIIQGEDSSTDIPLDMIHDSVFIGHTHPFHSKYLYMPPSALDIRAASHIPNRDWFIIDEKGIWVYNIDTQDTNEGTIDNIDLLACALMLDEITLETYLFQINSLPSVSIKFHSYTTMEQLFLYMT